MSEITTLPGDQAGEMVSLPGVTLLLGYHPRANLGLAVDLCIRIAQGGKRVFVLDCDRTINLDAKRPRLGLEVSKILLSHPENMDALVADLKAPSMMDDVGFVIINRPSSLIGTADLIEKFRGKTRLWTMVHHPIRQLGMKCPVLILEDSRRADQIEYKVHPALFYLSDTILDAVETGKDVEQYRIMKKRS